MIVGIGSGFFGQFTAALQGVASRGWWKFEGGVIS